MQKNAQPFLEWAICFIWNCSHCYVLLFLLNLPATIRDFQLGKLILQAVSHAYLVSRGFPY